jgi:hypothetical protein
VSADDIRHLFEQLVSPDAEQREAARLKWLEMDEDAVDLLAAEYYAGVPEKLGIALLDILGEIGGWEALNLINEVYYNHEVRPALRKAAHRALLSNRDNLDSAELKVLLQYDSGMDEENRT